MSYLYMRLLVVNSSGWFLVKTDSTIFPWLAFCQGYGPSSYLMLAMTDSMVYSTIYRTV